MKFLFDLFPIFLFFVTFKIYGIYAATAVAIAATFVQISWVWFRHRKVENMLWINLVIIVIFGSATLILQDETFIKWKPSVLYWLFSAVLFLAALFWNKNLIQSIMGRQIALPVPVWRVLNHAWAGFFAAMGVANLYVAYNFATDTWVNFKLFGTTGLMLTFVIVQSLFIAKYMKEAEQCPISPSNDPSNNQEKP